MRVARIYEPGEYELEQTITLSAAASQHVGVVLRKQVGEMITLFKGDNREFSAVITEVNKKQIKVRITGVYTVNRESPCQIALGQAISKGDRMEWVIQKAVELGVHQITPLITERCVVRLDEVRFAKKQAQWQEIANSACEQCGRNRVPLINPVSSLASYLQTISADLKLILDPQSKTRWRHLPTASTISLLIGPEGGLSEAEINQAIDEGFQGLSLGPRVLRTETAAITAVAMIQMVMGDF